MSTDGSWVFFAYGVVALICGVTAIGLTLVWIFTLFGILLPIRVNLLITVIAAGCYYVIWQIAPIIDAYKEERLQKERPAGLLTDPIQSSLT